MMYLRKLLAVAVLCTSSEGLAQEWEQDERGLRYIITACVEEVMAGSYYDRYRDDVVLSHTIELACMVAADMVLERERQKWEERRSELLNKNE